VVEFGRLLATLVALEVAVMVVPRRRRFHPIPDPKRLCSVANIKSQIKRNRQNEQARERNKAVKSALKTSIRRFREAAETGDADAARQLGTTASRKLDKAVSAGVIHKNQAANKKSSIAKRSASL
jgi:small subunit ribosomal protein S20